MSLSDTLHNSINQNEVSFWLFLDVKKAFNNVNPNRLCNADSYDEGINHCFFITAALPGKIELAVFLKKSIAKNNIV